MHEIDDPTAGTTRREFLTRAGVSLAALSAAGIGGLELFGPARARAADFAGTKEVAIGVMAPSHCAAPYVFAEVQQYYGKNGVKAELVFYQGMGEIADDLISGKIQFGQLMLPLLLAVHAKAGPFKDKGVPMLTTQPTGTKGGGITVRKDSGIRGIDDLAGRKVGSHSPLSAHYLLLQMFIRKNLALKAPIDVKVIPLEDMVPSLVRGDIDAFIMPEPVNAVAAMQGAGSLIFLTSKLWAAHPCCMLSTTAAFAGQNPGTVRAVSRSVAEAGLFAEQPGKRAAFLDGVTRHPSYQKVPRPVLEKAFEAGRADFFPFPYKSSARVAGDFMKTLGLLPAGVGADQIAALVDPAPARELLKEAGNDPGPDYRIEKVLGEDLSFG